MDEIKKRVMAGKTLTVKLGVDPTAKDVTLGWAVVLRKLRDFQKLGHIACLVVGDFTASIGDPSGKSKTRKQLTRKEVNENVIAVVHQFGRILDMEKTVIVFNSEWLRKFNMQDVIRLCSRYTVARILERDDFTNRLRDNLPIAMHEILYPLCQGMDSVVMNCDVEIGGNDQMFNNLVGRTLMEQYGLEPQAVVLCPLLVGLDGKEKMSQSLGNYISITDPPNEMFSKVMQLKNDDVIDNWFELCTDVDLRIIRGLRRGINEKQISAKDVKFRLAMHIVDLYHPSEPYPAKELPDGIELPVVGSKDDDVYYSGLNIYESEVGMTAFGTKAIESAIFSRSFSKGDIGSYAEEVAIPKMAIEDGLVSIPELLTVLGYTRSKGMAKDRINEGAVSFDDEKVFATKVPIEEVHGKVLKLGKKFCRLITP